MLPADAVLVVLVVLVEKDKKDILWNFFFCL